MSVDLSAVYTVTAPANTDGRGAIAVINDSTSANFVGNLWDASGFESPEVRESFDDVVEGDGGVHGNFYYGRRPFTMDILLVPSTTAALSHARLDKLLRATNAMRADGTITWTESGGVAKQLNFRRQQPIRGPSQERNCLFAGVSADPRIYSQATTPGLTFNNVGTVDSPPVIAVTPSSATCTLTNSGNTLTLLGLSGVAVTVDFAARTVKDGSGNSRLSAVAFPSSVWWAQPPGSSTTTITGGSGTQTSRSAWL